MEDSEKPDTILFAEFKTNCDAYELFISSELRELDDSRLHDIPKLLEQRKTEGEAFLEKKELSELMDWKLKHGTYRPNLAKLIASNSPEEARETTVDAFAVYEEDNAQFQKAIIALSKLKGVGPATASLILSSYDPVQVPFFSDELFRYLHWSEGKGNGWDRKINYTLREYRELYEKTQELRERLEEESGEVVKAIDLEKMAYALGKHAQREKESRVDEEEKDKEVKAPPSKRRRKNKS